LDLVDEVRLMGQMSREKLPDLYAQADAVVLTSHSEGIPVTLMEAMAMQRVVLAPEMTGLPELVSPGTTGFLYQKGSMEDFLTQLQLVLHAGPLMDKMRLAARRQVEREFNAPVNLAHFAHAFLERATPRVNGPTISVRRGAHEDPVLQQV
jgi:colanic acid/amylovoran biosynthesis glycosyltransferase